MTSIAIIASYVHGVFRSVRHVVVAIDLFTDHLVKDALVVRQTIGTEIGHKQRSPKDIVIRRSTKRWNIYFLETSYDYMYADVINRCCAYCMMQYLAR